MATPRRRPPPLTTSQVLARFTEGPDEGVFTDGSAEPNPGPGGWGAVYVVGGELVAQAHGHEPWTTNNRMEMTAIIEGIGLVPDGTPATVHTDSLLCYRTLTEWAAGWERLGWRRKRGEIQNLDLVQRGYALVRSRSEIRLAWIAAHAGNRWNEYADALSSGYRRPEL